MTHFAIGRGSRFLVAGLLLGATALLSPGASAGECPADQVKQGVRQSGETEPKGVSDTVLSHIDLATQAVKLEDTQFRMRRLVVEPGGVVPWHSHGERPALIYIVSGAITEYSSNCAVPIEHKAGDAAKESVGLAHWWKNNSNEPVVLISSDILHVKKDDAKVM
ncbi:cupin domain-containing protein [Limibacillus halophilus]|uniref:Quercetin dioxygenase-like cupin family protein n=1 Tax=Limibacillus halophilus TaxID=1579333 RepID=A0A839SM99_9PROT|nr:cupin domain-containing protein [Limibacillus halophilus]MBB3063951.1 quercetin dioxygenase-like cupin family protein [Limibacillus halophilus]